MSVGIAETIANTESGALKRYTAILLYPDYASDNYGESTWMDVVEADDPVAALAAARAQCAEGCEDIDDPEDLFCIALIEGDHDDVKPAE